jgi:tetratricopeptide (TPR) repeat protein
VGQAAAGLITEVSAINRAGYPLRGQPYLPHLFLCSAHEEQIDATQAAPVHNNLGYLLRAQGDLAGARPYYERALAIREQVLGPTHSDTALSLNNLGALLDSQGDLAGARPYYERALAIFTARLGPQHPTTQTVQRNLAVLDVPQEGREVQIARLTREAEAQVAETLATSDVAQRTALAIALERRAQWAADGEAEGSPYVALAVRLRELVAQLG